MQMARVPMMTEDLDAASAAFEVGYESAGQFNREYRSFWPAAHGQQLLFAVKPVAKPPQFRSAWID
jgi:hypothetical protein